MSPAFIDKIIAENELLKAELERVNGILLLLKREIYGPKSEKTIYVSPDQMVFNEIEVEATTLPEPEKETITYTRNKGKQIKKPFPEHLDREEVIIDLNEEQKVCPHDGSRLKEIGEEISQKIRTIPAKTTIVIEKKKKYACTECEGYMTQAKVDSILPGTVATAETLSFIVFSKFFQALPLYRLEEYYKLSGIDLKRGTMARWLIQISEKLMPIWNILEEKVMMSGYSCIDATNVQVLKEKGRAAESKSFMWVRGSPELGIVLFDYNVSGGGVVAKKLVTDFSGALQADAHRGYGAIDQTKLLLLGCMMHARRRFYKAWIVGKKSPGIATDALKMFDFIYYKEEQYKSKGLTPEERKVWRDKEVAPSLEEIKKWCGWQLEKVPPSSLVANALSYFINEYTELTAFLKNGRYEIDNGWIERVIKRFAIGRKNWLFNDTVQGAEASSLLYSLTLTAKLNGKDPFQTMAEILKQLPRASTVDDYERLANLLLSPANLLSCLKKEGAIIH